MRLACLPPSNSVEKYSSIIESACFSSIYRPGMTSILESLCRRVMCAISGDQHNAARTFECLFNVIAMPSPVPQIAIPFDITPSSTALHSV